jgi:hypothetical protein
MISAGHTAHAFTNLEAENDAFLRLTRRQYLAEEVLEPVPSEEKTWALASFVVRKYSLRLDSAELIEDWL